jgi:hypothetical protein
MEMYPRRPFHDTDTAPSLEVIDASTAGFFVKHERKSNGLVDLVHCSTSKVSCRKPLLPSWCGQRFFHHSWVTRIHACSAAAGTCHTGFPRRGPHKVQPCFARLLPCPICICRFRGNAPPILHLHLFPSGSSLPYPIEQLDPSTHRNAIQLGMTSVPAALACQV